VVQFQTFGHEQFYALKSTVCPTGCGVFSTYDFFSLRSTQSQMAVLAPLETYRLTIDLRVFGNNPTTLDVAELFLFVRPFGGTTTYTHSRDLLRITPQFETYSLLFTSEAGTPRPFDIGFSVNPRDRQSAVAVDSFRLETVESVLPVPLPAAGLMLLAGIAGLGGMRAAIRRRR
jgi:hypothetical protein